MRAVKIGIKELDELKINYENVKKCEVSFDPFSPLELYRIPNGFSSEVYIFSMPEIEKVASQPEVVGKEMESLMYKTGKAISRIIFKKHNLRGKSIFVLIPLRGGVGYYIHKAMFDLSGSVRVGYVRPKYIEGFGDHVNKKPVLVAHNLHETLPRNENLTVIIQDTWATGNTGIVSIETLLELIEKFNTDIKEFIITGFMTQDAIENIERFLKPYGIRLTCYSYVNLPELAKNRYDMTWNPDPSTLEERGKVEYSLDPIVPLSVGKRMLEKFGFVPGTDQPGDFSERQQELMSLEVKENGEIRVVVESGNIRKHLEDSQKRVELLENMFLPTLEDSLRNIIGRNIEERKSRILNLLERLIY